MNLQPVIVPADFVSPEGRPIVLIEYSRCGPVWMPHQVFVQHSPDHPNYCSHFDFDWCKRDQALLYHESGCGPGAYLNGWTNAKKSHAKLWWNSGAGVELRTGGGDPVTDFLALGFKRITTPVTLGKFDLNPFSYGMEGEVVYCTKCEDHLSEDDVCEHIFWCERCEEWGGAEGNKSRCRHRKPSSV